MYTELLMRVSQKYLSTFNDFLSLKRCLHIFGIHIYTYIGILETSKLHFKFWKHLLLRPVALKIRQNRRISQNKRDENGKYNLGHPCAISLETVWRSIQFYGHQGRSWDMGESIVERRKPLSFLDFFVTKLLSIYTPLFHSYFYTYLIVLIASFSSIWHFLPSKRALDTRPHWVPCLWRCWGHFASCCPAEYSH